MKSLIYIIVAVYIYLATTDGAYIAWSTAIEWYLSCDIRMDIKNVHILVSSHWIPFQVYPQTNLLVPHMYTNIHSNQHKIAQLTWNYMVHTFNIHTFDSLTGWILLHLSTNWSVHKQ